MPNDYPFPCVIDSSMLACFRSCPRKFYLTYIQHWKPKADNVHLHAGGAFAAGLEEARRSYYENGLSPEDSVARGLAALLKFYGKTFACPEDSPKTLERMAMALVYHFDEYPLATDPVKPIKLTKTVKWFDEELPVETNKRAIEFRFNEEFPFVCPDTQKFIRYVGRSDMIVDYANGVYIHDDKTTSYLGASWAEQWDLRSQFTGYVWAAQKCGFTINGVVVRGIAILKTKFNTQQALTQRSQWEVDRWVKQVHNDLCHMQNCYDTNYWDYNLDAACSQYGGCEFRRVCRSPHPEDWLPSEFTRRVWNPLDETETELTKEDILIARKLRESF